MALKLTPLRHSLFYIAARKRAVQEVEDPKNRPRMGFALHSCRGQKFNYEIKLIESPPITMANKRKRQANSKR